MATTVVLNTYYEVLADSGDSDAALVGYFKIAEGGWTDSSGTPQPRTPLSTQTDVDALENPGRYPADGQYVFTKTLTAADVVNAGNGVMTITCDVDPLEANDDGDGNAPEFWEIMVFTPDDVPILYRTFDKQTKTSLLGLRHVFNVRFQPQA